MAGACPISSWYCRAMPTSRIVWATTGWNAAVNTSEAFPLKYSVAAVGLPVRIFRASSKLIAVIASRKIGLAPGAARSAARFMLSTSSSICGPYCKSPQPFLYGLELRGHHNLRVFNCREILTLSSYLFH